LLKKGALFMERIICDSYQKGDKHLFDDDPNTEFNQKIMAVNNMYGWLYEKGILRKVSFEFKDYSDITFFAFDAKELLPYRKAMEASGIDGAKLATEHIFDAEYSLCKYSGAIELSWTMFTYRDFGGTISRSWETDLCRHLNSPAVLDIRKAREQQGIKEAVKLSFELSGFEKSDLITVRALIEDDCSEVEVLDEFSGNELSDGLGSEGYVWGVFYDNKLVGYCSIGGAEDYDEFDGWDYDDLVLCDVFILEEFRGMGLASELIETVISENTAHGEKIFLTILDDHLAEFYEKFGFEVINEDGGVMLREAKPRSLDEKIQIAQKSRTITPLMDNDIFEKEKESL
jgi:GNAT superfamily N-acetyltransferase